MKKNQTIKRQAFSFRFSKNMILFSILAMLLCVVGVIVSVLRIVKYGLDDFQDYLKSPFLILICLAGIVVLTALLIKAEYVVDEKYLRSNFGVIKSRIEVSKITALTSDPQTGKVSVYVGEEFFVASLTVGKSEDFCSALLKVNPKINYSFTLTDNKPQEDEEKK